MEKIMEKITEEIEYPQTAEEAAAAAKCARISAIDRRLRELDQASIRPSRSAALAVSKGEAPNGADVERLAGYEAEITALREERGRLA
jgi:hypothetical protein